MPKSIHDEHRKRVRDEFLAHGFDENTPPHKIIEMLLFYSIPRVDTNEVAHRLVERFKSLRGVLEAPESELLKINGIGPNTVAFFKLFLSVVSLYIDERNKDVKRFNDMESLCEFLKDKYFGKNEEIFSIVTLNNGGNLQAFDVLGKGDVSTVSISTREVIATAILRNATAVVMAHNHPGGNALPSKEDIDTTERIYEALRNINIILLDHIIIAGDDYISMFQSKQYKYIFKHANNE